RLELEDALDPGEALEEPLEARPAEPERVDLLAHPHRRRARAPLEEAELAYELARADRPERGLGRVLAAAHGARPPRDDEVDGVRGLALADDRLAEAVGDALELLAEGREGLGRQVAGRGSEEETLPQGLDLLAG